MLYRAVGVVSGSSLNGLDIGFAELQETTGKWTADIIAGERIPYTVEWKSRLTNAANLSVTEYQALNIDYSKYLASVIMDFINRNQLHYKVQLIACQGHISVYKSDRQIYAELGDGATIAALTGINVVGQVRNIDLALGGRGAPVFPVAEKLLFADQQLFLHLGTNATLSRHQPGDYKSFDVCPANRLLDSIAARDNKPFDPAGMMASEGKVDDSVLELLNELDYYHMPLPKSLSADFGTDVVLPLLSGLRLNVTDALRTACEHIAMQVAAGVKLLTSDHAVTAKQLLVTGGGANNDFLLERIRTHLGISGFNVLPPEKMFANFKEPLAMALIGVLRWREENNVFSYITGASRDSIGGAVWIGQEA